ncbi:MAG: hypothetical protein HYV33_01080 [Candidatus Kerfeldbacteria bacterium]|nr:hypothetical protein [Candidatus Kerfeldbacteria bacterium]
MSTQTQLEYYFQPLREVYPKLTAAQRLLVRSVLAENFFDVIREQLAPQLYLVSDENFIEEMKQRVAVFVATDEITSPLLEGCFQAAKQHGLNSILALCEYTAIQYSDAERDLQRNRVLANIDDDTRERRIDTVHQQQVELLSQIGEIFPEMAPTLNDDLTERRRLKSLPERKLFREPMH